MGKNKNNKKNNYNNSSTENYIRTEVEQFNVPDSLTPDNIKDRLSYVNKEPASQERDKHFLTRTRLIAGIAACFIIMIASVTLIRSGIITDHSNSDNNQTADNNNSNNTAAISDSDSKESSGDNPDNNSGATDNHTTGTTTTEPESPIEVADTTSPTSKDHTTYSDIYDVLNAHYKETFAYRGHYSYKSIDGAIVEEANDAESAPAADGAISNDAAMKQSAADTGSAGSSDYTDTDIQVEGVMESDLVKTDGQYIYVLKCPDPFYYGIYDDVAVPNNNNDNSNTRSVIIYKNDGNKADKISTIKLSSVKDYSDYRYGQWDMYLSDGKLILIGTESAEKKDEQKDNNKKLADLDIMYRGKSVTAIYVYDVSDPANPVKLARHTQSGDLADTRVSDGYLYTISNYNVMTYDLYINREEAIIEDTTAEDNNSNDSDKLDMILNKGNKSNTEKKKKKEPDNNLPFDKNDTKAYIPCVNDEVIPEEKMYLPKGSKDIENYLVMTSIDIGNPDKIADKSASLDWSYTYYVSNSNIYVTHTDYDNDNYTSFTMIDKYHYDKGNLSYVAHAKVKGIIYNSYCMHEYKDHFVYVYTAEQYKNDEFIPSNGIAILDENLKKTGQIDNLGKNETIQSSYYIDNMAYFVTYRNTDPVFAVDISDPANPILKSELKLPGFSEYLHSFGTDEDGNTLLIGIGRGNKEVTLDNANENVDENRVKLSLFTVSKDGQVTETRKHWEDKLSYCYTYDRHEVFIDEANKIIGYNLYNDSANGNNTRHSFVLYHYENGKFKRIYQHVIKDENSYEGFRGLRIDDIFYLINTHVDKNTITGTKLSIVKYPVANNGA